MSRAKGPTLRMVAEAAGVSQTTASMILNGKPGVSFSPETILRVRQTADRLGYAAAQPGALPLFGGRTVVIFSATITGYYYTSLIQAIERDAQARGLETICYQTYHDAGREETGLSLFGRSDVAGIIFTYVPRHFRQLEAIMREQGIPAVVIGDHDEAVRINMVETNNHIAGQLMARHILSLGHRRVAFLNDRFEWQGYPSSARLGGVRAVFDAEQPDAELVVYTSEAQGELQIGDYMKRQQLGYDLTAACMAERPDVTALLCVTDMLAYGALDYMRRHALRVPDDYSVCGFDNNFAADLLGLTTHDHHVPEIGAKALEMLYQRIAAQPAREPETITKMEMIGQIVVRASSGTPGVRAQEG